jgi:hypothetical protein
MSLWDSVLQLTAKAGESVTAAGLTAKVKGELLLVDREIQGRKQAFGVTLYDHVAPLSSHVDFWAGDDPLTATIRPPLLVAQREIRALELRQRKVKEHIKTAEATRAAAFPTPAATLGDKVLNAGKSAVLAGNETKLWTDHNVILTQIKGHKQTFGEQLFDILVEKEDKEGWLPTNREIRSIYDNARQDVEKLIKKRRDKEADLPGGPPPPAAPPAAIAPMSLGETVSSYGNGYAAPQSGASAAYGSTAVPAAPYNYGQAQPPVAAPYNHSPPTHDPVAVAVPVFDVPHHHQQQHDPFASVTLAPMPTAAVHHDDDNDPFSGLGSKAPPPMGPMNGTAAYPTNMGFVMGGSPPLTMNQPPPMSSSSPQVYDPFSLTVPAHGAAAVGIRQTAAAAARSSRGAQNDFLF